MCVENLGPKGCDLPEAKRVWATLLDKPPRSAKVTAEAEGEVAIEAL